ncbi:MAG: PEP-CTERM sorting domain-containing protein [Candidatus Korobacteraceae bacterium]|jgi:hypothetical protein
MKLRIASLSLLALCLTLAALPAMAQTVYDNGPINGNTDAWVINSAFFVTSDTFNVTHNSTTIAGASFGVWLSPGDTFPFDELSITSGENGGTSYFDQIVNFTTGSCTLNRYGYNVCQENTSFSGPTLNSGTYWLNLQYSLPEAPAYWDENSGPSSASTSDIGTIPSEAFTLLGGTGITSTSSTTSSGTVPEPSSVLLLGSGMVGLLGVLRRKRF